MLDMVADLAGDVSVLFLWCLWSCWDGVNVGWGHFLWLSFHSELSAMTGTTRLFVSSRHTLAACYSSLGYSLPWDTFPTALSHAFQILISGVSEGV